MKTTIQIRRTVRLVFILAFLLFPMVYTNSAWSAQGNLKQVTLKVEGMYCAACPATVRLALKRLPGVVNAKVSYKEKKATVLYREDKVTVAQMIKAIKDSGYGASQISGINEKK
ncbi:copper chaperone CopZ [bacterium BMS3Abin07]|nr:copper chaperone CopZ [bacterium BMS3Abin07]GBE33240.1 copper chaperone CopZ [bacterium BMS3Bbin05]HDL20762.1 heavy-metal-associated domain-containing protein [Nitrospirota bacterium]HDO23183.1 heavy-metal-associated domain-containing protein [Nitrospirota bacterium]HDZ88884.1 heavy-metal-associated domain-containing protein [Nitrospirota bacterium]